MYWCLLQKLTSLNTLTNIICNVTYKCITKIIMNRLKPSLPSLILPFQASFILKRNIQDNIIIAQELMHSLKKMRERRGFFVIKVDLEKAYDCLN